MAKRSLKTRFPGFASTFIQDKRGVGYYLTSLKDRLSLDARFYDDLAVYCMDNNIPKLPPSFWDSLISAHIENRGGYIRGNAYPLNVDVIPFHEDIHSALEAATSATHAVALSPLVYAVLSVIGLWNIKEGPLTYTVEMNDNSIQSMISTTLSASLMSRVILASALTKQVDVLVAQVKAYGNSSLNSKDVAGGKENVRISNIAFQLANLWTLFRLNVLSHKRVLLEILKASVKVVAWTVANDTYVPISIKEDVIAQFLNYGNSCICKEALTSSMSGAPTQTEEQRFEQGLQMFTSALGDSKGGGRLWEAKSTSELCKHINQYTVTMAGETPARTIHVTEWYYQKVMPTFLAYMPDYGSGASNTYFVRPCNNVGSNIAACLAPLSSVSAMLEEKWEHTSHAHASTGLNWINALGAKPYASDAFCDAIVRILALYYSRSVHYNSGFVYDVAGWDDNSIAPTSGREGRYIYETDAYKAVSQTLIPTSTHATAFKHASALEMIAGDAVIQLDLAIKNSSFTLAGIPVDKATNKPNLAAAPKATAITYSLDLQPLEINMHLYSWLGVNKDVAPELYFETSLLAAAADKTIDSQLKAFNAVPITGANASHYARTLKLQLFRTIAEAADKIFGALTQTLQANYTGWAPTYWTQGATQSARICRQQAVLEFYVQVLRALGISCADELESLLNNCIDNFSAAELVGI
jgi:hypothetical protein